MDQSNSPQVLPFARLVRTTHDKDGTSVFASDEQVTPFAPFGPKATHFAVFDTRQSVPVNNTDPIPSFENTLPRCPPGGALFGITEIPPGGVAPMHRTTSLDYAIVMSGEIVLGLDGGEQKTIRAGEFLVQQGVSHQWINNSQQVCRMAWAMIGAEKVLSKDGQPFEQTAFKIPPPS